MRRTLDVVMVALARLLGATAAFPAAAKPAVLFIAVDDLDHWVGQLAKHLPKVNHPALKGGAGGE